MHVSRLSPLADHHPGGDQPHAEAALVQLEVAHAEDLPEVVAVYVPGLDSAGVIPKASFRIVRLEAERAWQLEPLPVTARWRTATSAGSEG